MPGWTADDLRTAALWTAADRVFATYRLYAEELAARVLQARSADAGEGSRDTSAGCSPE